MHVVKRHERPIYPGVGYVPLARKKGLSGAANTTQITADLRTSCSWWRRRQSRVEKR